MDFTETGMICLVEFYLFFKNLNMGNQLNSTTTNQIKECLDLLKEVLGKDLLGVYLYGSAVLGGLQKYSDVDLFVITSRATTKEEKITLVTNLLQISGVYMQSAKLPIEMTIVEKTKVNPWHYPPEFDFQYGDWLRQEFESGNFEPWSNRQMPGLAIMITQLLLANRVLFGPEPSELLCKVPYKDFIAANVKEMHGLVADLDWDTRNVLLTYCRIWSTVKTNCIRSKPDAAAWAINHLPKKYQCVIQRAKAICLSQEAEYWDDMKDLLKPCVNFMIEQITERVALIAFSKSENNQITLEQSHC